MTASKSIQMNLEEKIRQSETKVFKVVFPNVTNHHNTMFGGTVMEMMDEVAFMTATRFARKRFVTVSCDRIDFKKPIPADSLIEIVGNVKSVGNSSVKVNIKIYIEQMYNETREKAVEGDFTLVALGDNQKPVKVLEC